MSAEGVPGRAIARVLLAAVVGAGWRRDHSDEWTRCIVRGRELVTLQSQPEWRYTQGPGEMRSPTGARRGHPYRRLLQRVESHKRLTRLLHFRTSSLEDLRCFVR